MPTKRQRRTRKRTPESIESLWLAGSLPPDYPATAETAEFVFELGMFEWWRLEKVWPGKFHPHQRAWNEWCEQAREAINAN